jgi:4-amino-4-deoxy-L-arabinose transferase-like glycosyltransferase
MNAATNGELPGARRLVLIVLLLNAFSSILFISTVNRPVYDDPNNLPDVHRYTTEGVSTETIRQHRNPTGPTSFLWMAAGARIFGGNELRDARVAVLASWLFLGAGILIWAERGSSAQLWYSALLVTLVFPHAVTASATILTEGPALFFATLGALAWVESISTVSPSPRLLFLWIAGGLSMGIAITCRQYYLA